MDKQKVAGDEDSIVRKKVGHRNLLLPKRCQLRHNLHLALFFLRQLIVNAECTYGIYFVAKEIKPVR